jgi:LPXTG-motif cell wall-anchored protein
MKKLALTIAIVLGLSMTTFADGGGIFQRGYNASNDASGYNYFGSTDMNRGGDALTPMLPAHGQGTNQNAPVGSGIVVLMGLGAAYLVGKRRKEE